MWDNKLIKEKIKEVDEFSKNLKNFVVLNNQININESLINIYNKYDISLRRIMTDLNKCEENKNNLTECVKSFIVDYDKLRSDISKNIEKSGESTK